MWRIKKSSLIALFFLVSSSTLNAQTILTKKPPHVEPPSLAHALSTYHLSAGPASHEQAKAWFDKSGDIDSPTFNIDIGIKYDRGFSIMRSREKALEHYKKAALAGELRAYSLLAKLYLLEESHEAVQPDYEKALYWLTKGFASKDLASTVYLGLMHLEGLGVSQDTSKSITLLSHAANRGDAYALYALGSMLFNGINVRPDTTQAQLRLAASCEAGLTHSCRAAEDLFSVLKK